MEEGGFKKKFLAPLVVIMLCAVALAGAAYAWSTSVHGDGSIPDSDYYSINLYYKENEKYIPLDNNFSTVDESSFVAYTTKEVKGTYHGCVTDAKVQFVTYVKVESGADVQIDFTPTATYTNKSGEDSMYAGWANTTPEVTITDVTGSPVTDGYYTNEYYKVTIDVTFANLDVDLKTTEPKDVASKMKFVGEDCICLNLVAAPHSA